MSQIFKDQLIVRAPDKMIDYFCNFILIAYRNLIVAINVTDLKIDGAGAVESSDKVIETAIEEGSITYLDLQNSYKIIAMQELGNHTMTSIVLEDLSTRQIRFLRVQVPDAEGPKKAVKFVQLGLVVNNTSMSVSPLLKYRSVSKINP